MQVELASRNPNLNLSELESESIIRVRLQPWPSRNIEGTTVCAGIRQPARDSCSSWVAGGGAYAGQARAASKSLTQMDVFHDGVESRSLLTHVTTMAHRRRILTRMTCIVLCIRAYWFVLDQHGSKLAWYKICIRLYWLVCCCIHMYMYGHVCAGSRPMTLYSVTSLI